MASRPRSTKKRGWPDGLYERGGYYSWRNPLTGVEMGIGRVTFGEAKAQAAEANIAVAGLRDKPRLVHRLDGQGENTWRAWLAAYQRKMGIWDEKLGIVADSQLPVDKELAAGTRATYAAVLRKIRLVWKEQLDLPIKHVSTKVIADGIDRIKAKTPTMAVAVRARLHQVFDMAIAQGWLDRGQNPVAVTEAVSVKVKRARFTWEVFKQLYDALPPGRLKNAAALAVVSGQPREVLCAAKFTDVGMLKRPGQEPIECWMFERGKTHVKIAIPLDVRLNAFGLSLREVIAQCRSTGVVSRHMLHVHKRHAHHKLGAAISPSRLTNEFGDAVAALGIDWGENTPPSLHEIRSLSKRLYKQQGGVDTKDLLGHKTEAMSALYEDARGAEYLLVSIAG
jgi:enterobacteria phage integrase